MPKKKEPPLSPNEQRRRFEALARQAGASASSKQLREMLGRIAKSRPEKDDTKKAKK
jgi:hypothetical protein